MSGKLTQIFRRLFYGEPVIVVSGLPRSGTSMAMKMLEAGGVPVVTDGVREADVDNPKGYYEDERVLRLAEDVDRSWLRGERGRAVKIISYLLKHLPKSNNYKVVLMRRGIDEILASQAKMLERRGEPNEGDDAQMRELLESDLWRATYLIKNASHLEALDLHYAAALKEPRLAAEQISQFLGRPMDVDKMAAIVDPSLYRNRG